MNKKLIAFNWKMNPQSLAEAKQLLAQVKGERLKAKGNKFDLVICPPFTHLSLIAGLINKTRVKLGAQNVFWENPKGKQASYRISSGAYTGEISPQMLKNLGVEYVIIGHSERRKYLNETNEMINKKVLAALKAELKVILCVGEPIRRGKGKEESKKKAQKFIKTQLQKDLKNLSPIHFLPSSLIIAYEPIWAISTTKKHKLENPQDAIEMSIFIKKMLQVSSFKFHDMKVLYGGSVDSKDILDFIKHKEIDGALVGHASVKKEEVKKIVKILNNQPR